MTPTLNIPSKMTVLVLRPEESVEPLRRRIRGAQRHRRQVEGEGRRARQGVGVGAVGQLGGQERGAQGVAGPDGGLQVGGLT